MHASAVVCSVNQIGHKPGLWVRVLMMGIVDLDSWDPTFDGRGAIKLDRYDFGPLFPVLTIKRPDSLVRFAY